MARPLPELKLVDEVAVYKNRVLAAHLVRRDDGIEFAYDAAYVATERPPVALSLPLGSTVRTVGGALPPFFAGLLPEGRRLTALRVAAKTSADDELTLLLAVGADVVGDVQLVAASEPLPDEDSRLEVHNWSDVRFRDLFARAGGEPAVLDRAGIAGVQEKVSARVISVPVAGKDARYILKLDPPEFPHLVANEAFFLAAARASGLPTTDAELVTDADGMHGLLVTRFDRVVADGHVALVAQEDGCQVLERYPADKYAIDTAELVRGLASVTGAPVVAARDLLRQLVFAYLTGNGDAHAKNFSVVNIGGEWRVAPAYDQPSSYPYGDVSLALPIDGRVRERVRRDEFVALGAQVGLRAKATERLIDELVDRASLWYDDLESLPFDRRRLHKFKRFVADRRAGLASTS